MTTRPPHHLATRGIGIIGTGMYAPERIMTNADLARMIETNDDWIVSRTGIRERRVAAPDEATSDLATAAALRAIESAGIDPALIDLIICCTFSPDRTIPNTACQVQARLGLTGKCAAFDLNAACSGFVYGLAAASAFHAAGFYRHSLVIGADIVTRSLDYSERETCVLFGDGAGAAILGPVDPGRGLVGQFLCADGASGDAILIYDSGTRMVRLPGESPDAAVQMKGKEVFRFAVRVLGPALEKALAQGGAPPSIADFDLIIPHQANLRILEAASTKYGIPMEKFVINIDRYANTSAATIPMALAEASAAGRLKPGDLVGLVSFGGGLTYGASAWIW